VTETSATTIRLTEEDRSNADAIIGSGAATNISEAIRVALAEYARTAPRMKAIERRLGEAVRRTAPREIELLPGGGRIDVVIPKDQTRGVQRVLARVLTAEGQSVADATLEWRVEPSNLAKVVVDGKGTTWLESLREGEGTLHVRSGQLEKISLIDVWKDHPELSLPVRDYRLNG
jgi:Arc/MetJ-type ribon-helix-helix transcriptional regulator